MKLVTANGKQYLQMTKSEWEKMGKDNGWGIVTAKKVETPKEEKKSEKKGKPVNPWAVCHTTTDKDKDPAKYERCVQDVKKEHPIKKD